MKFLAVDAAVNHSLVHYEAVQRVTRIVHGERWATLGDVELGCRFEDLSDARFIVRRVRIDDSLGYDQIAADLVLARGRLLEPVSRWHLLEMVLILLRTLDQIGHELGLGPPPLRSPRGDYVDWVPDLRTGAVIYRDPRRVGAAATAIMAAMRDPHIDDVIAVRGDAKSADERLRRHFTRPLHDDDFRVFAAAQRGIDQ